MQEPNREFQRHTLRPDGFSRRLTLERSAMPRQPTLKVLICLSLVLVVTMCFGLAKARPAQAAAKPPSAPAFTVFNFPGADQQKDCRPRREHG